MAKVSRGQMKVMREKAIQARRTRAILSKDETWDFLMGKEGKGENHERVKSNDKGRDDRTC